MKKVFAYLLLCIFFIGCPSPVKFIPKDSVAADPVFSLVSKVYDTEQTLTIKSATPDVEIFYTLDGSNPGRSSTKYSSEIFLTDVGHVHNFRAIALKSDLHPSAIVEAQIEIVFPTLSQMVLTPEPGTYNSDQTILPSCGTPGVTYFYTTDNKIPSINSSLFAGLNLHGDGSSSSLWVMAYKPGYRPTFFKGDYFINFGKVSTPGFTPSGGTYANDITNLIISCPVGETPEIFYTLDDSDPETSLTRLSYTAPISLVGHGSTMHLKAVALQSGKVTSSVRTGDYLIKYNQLQPLVITPAGNNYIGDQYVFISSPESGVSIYYTNLGSEPSINSIPYTEPILIKQGAPTTIKAIGIKTGFLNSPVASETFTIDYEAVGTPVPSHIPGTVTDNLNLTLTCPTPGALIEWAKDDLGTTYDEGQHWFAYSGTVLLEGDGKTYNFKARATKAGMSESPLFQGSYAIDYPNLDGAVFGLGPGSSDVVKYVTISSNEPGAVIYYTTDGSIPNGLSAVYSNPIIVAKIGATKTIKAIVMKTKFTKGPLTQQTYAISLPEKSLGHIAGSGELGKGDGHDSLLAQLQNPVAITKDELGNLYIVDMLNHRIRKVGTGGIITTIAGNGLPGYSEELLATNSMIHYPQGITLGEGADIYFSDTGNHRVRKVTETGVISTVVGIGIPGFSGDGGFGSTATLNSPTGLFYDKANKKLFICDTLNNRIRMLDTDTGLVSTFAGTGSNSFYGDGLVATSAAFNEPVAISMSLTTGDIYVADTKNNRIRKIAVNKITSTIVGTGFADHTGDGGLATSATLSGPEGIFVSPSGRVYISDTGNHTIRYVEGASIYSFAGTGNPGFSNGTNASSAEFISPGGIFVTYNDTNSLDTVIISDSGNNRIRKIDESNICTYLAGCGFSSFSGDNGPAISAQISQASFLAISPYDGSIYISDTGNHRIRKINAGIITTVVGREQYGYSNDGTLGTQAYIFSPQGLAITSNNELIFAEEGNQRIRILLSNGRLGTIVGTGAVGDSESGALGVDSEINSPTGLCIKAGVLYFSDSGNHKIKQINLSGPDKNIYLVAGSDLGFSGDGGPGINASINDPRGLDFTPNGNLVFADTGNNRIRQIWPNGLIETIAGNGTDSNSSSGELALDTSISSPMGVTIDPYGRIVFTENDGYRIRILDFEGYLTDLAGDGQPGNMDLDQNHLGTLTGVLYNSNGCYFIDTKIEKIRILY